MKLFTIIPIFMVLHLFFAASLEDNTNSSVAVELTEDLHATNNQDKEVFTVVEEMPRFPGCEDLKASDKAIKDCSMKKMIEFISMNLTYPKEAKTNKTEGTAIIEFVVLKSGKLDDIKLKKDPGHGCGDAAMEVIQKMNAMNDKWIPGRQRGKAVNVLLILPVQFKLS